MEESSRVSMPGLILAAMLHDMEGQQSDLEGFLFGFTVRQVVQSQEDARAGVQEGKTLLPVQGFVGTGRPFSFYDDQGRVLPDRLRTYLADKPSQSLIGWFKFRRNSPLRPSARELEVHAQLCHMYQNEINKNRGMKHFGFIMGLFTSYKSSEIITYDYRFMQIDVSRQIRPVKLEVINLQHSPQEEYESFAPVTDMPATSTSFLAPMRESVKMIDNLFVASIAELKAVVQEVHESSAGIRKMEREIDELKRSLGLASSVRPLKSSFGV